MTDRSRPLSEPEARAVAEKFKGLKGYVFAAAGVAVLDAPPGSGREELGPEHVPFLVLRRARAGGLRTDFVTLLFYGPSFLEVMRTDEAPRYHGSGS